MHEPGRRLRSPCVKDSSATIVATPTAIPSAVSAVRAGRRRRFVEMIVSIDRVYAGPSPGTSAGRSDT